MKDRKLLQVILDGQVALKKTLKADIRRVETKVEKNGERLDKLGEQIAYLEDNAPTQEAFGKLEKRVNKVEKVVISA